MRSHRFLLSLVLLSLTPLLAQSTKPEAPAGMDHSQAASKAPPSQAERSFSELKSLAGVWEGHVTMTPAFQGADSAEMRVTMRITSRGHALVHEMKGANDSDDPAKYDHPLTMFYVDGNELDLVHYCDAGNRPHMVAHPSADEKSVAFDLADLSGSDKRGHMNNAVFTFIDANHHIEEWTYMMPGNKPMRARVELHRIDDPGTSSSGK